MKNESIVIFCLLSIILLIYIGYSYKKNTHVESMPTLLQTINTDKQSPCLRWSNRNLNLPRIDNVALAQQLEACESKSGEDPWFYKKITGMGDVRKRAMPNNVFPFGGEYDFANLRSIDE